MRAVRRWAAELKREVMVVYFAMKHPKTPWHARVFGGLVVAYALSPIDLIPDFIPVLGLLDDLILIPAGLALLLRMIPPDVIDECREQAAEQSEHPKSLAGAAAIVAVWLLSIALLARFLMGRSARR